MDEIDVYEVLVKEHENMLFAYALGLVKDPALAQDVCQQAFLTGFRKLHTLRNKDAFAAWLRTIARNLAYTELNKRNKEVSWDPELIHGMEDVFQAFDQIDADELWQERLQIVKDCYQNLPEKLRIVCTLHYFEDQPLKEIMSTLEVSLDAIKKRLERARDSLRDCVERKLMLQN